MKQNSKRDEQQHMRRIAFLAIVLSTVAVVSSVVTLPTLYSFVQALESHLMVEADFCKSRSRDMWSEMTALQIGKRYFDRIKREWLFGQWVPDSGLYGGGSNNYEAAPIPGAMRPSGGMGPVINSEFNSQCCTCHQVNELI
ncbi:unnamed protein product [Gongylonema pulchrum]|uniref:Col_cuticle_N domain-containing protein n=1 Tax=Gongylonema pulchrum TaxID=637853 RepID=A0A183DGI8_9BILA|nr:unnamed protein product [Gongylonema pulchrum]